VTSLVLAFAAGALSFFAPCVVPLLPAYVGYLSGAALSEARTDIAAVQLRIVRGGVLYVLGFGLVFVALGVAGGGAGPRPPAAPATACGRRRCGSSGSAACS
jgi:cytochrome c-type biogenesis protein